MAVLYRLPRFPLRCYGDAPHKKVIYLPKAMWCSGFLRFLGVWSLPKIRLSVQQAYNRMQSLLSLLNGSHKSAKEKNE